MYILREFQKQISRPGMINIFLKIFQKLPLSLEKKKFFTKFKEKNESVFNLYLGVLIPKD